MIYVLWAILNVGLFLYFLYFLTTRGKLIRQKFGLFAAVIFVFVLLSFVCKTNSNDDNLKPGTNELRKWEFAHKDSVEQNTLIK